MKVIKSFKEFEQQYLQSLHTLGFQNWTVVALEALTDEEKATIESVKFPAGHMVCLVTVAHSVEARSEVVIIIDDTRTVEEMRSACFDSYLADMKHRVQGIDPGCAHGFCEYDNWEEFKQVWLTRDGKPVLPHIYPLLFDLPSDLEFLQWQKTHKTPLSYRRLIVTLYGAKKDSFYKIFVNNANKEDIAHYLLLVQAYRGQVAAW